MSHREAMRAVGATLIVLALALAAVGVVLLAGWGIVALYLWLLPASWLAPVSIGLAIVGGVLFLAGVLYCAFRDIPPAIVVVAPAIYLLTLLAWLMPKGMRSFLME